MLDIEIKNILQEQFSKEKNYQQIIYNLNKKQNKNIYDTGRRAMRPSGH